MRRLLLCSLLLAALPAFAGVYTYIDQDGNRVFTDQPKRSNAQRIELAPSNAMPPAPADQYNPYAPSPPPSPPQYQLLRILVPEPDATIRANNGEMIVSVSSDPTLLPGHSYRLLLDGKSVGEPGRSPVFPLHNVDRGTHQLSVEILDGQGRTLEQTPNQPFHMKRVSIAGNPNPAQPGLATIP
ncbi:DUF4124 domain-containing protein [Pseudomonas schmalbachii]|uniref:DUF4124 domain-containing protein n=1 Tax=Pseudomonas schmalbachii TaxID=2816993 RepID=A0ABS3TWF7_9PSED|nr:DUF4124 domain-containing protein [Pseudomonas schmalbachii]MBO3278002.1 DUF4124 domain-containing protein [Pseudomonas schmalbachii]